MELEESSKRMVAPRVVTWNQVWVIGKQIAGLITVGQVTSSGDLKGLSLDVEILLLL